jgi:hypothetical protein
VDEKMSPQGLEPATYWVQNQMAKKEMTTLPVELLNNKFM